MLQTSVNPHSSITVYGTLMHS